MILDHEFLDLLQGGSVDGLAGLNDFIVHDLQGNVGHLGLHRARGHDGGEGTVAVDGGIAACTCRVGSAGILADLLQVDLAKYLTQHVSLDAVLQTVRRLGVIPVDAGVGLRGLHLASEVVDGLALGMSVSVHPVADLTLLARQRSDVLLDERTDNSFVEVTHEEEGVVGCVGSALLGNLQHAVIVHALQILYMEGLVAPAVVVEDIFH